MHTQPCLLLFIDDNQPRFRRLQEAFSDPMTEVYLLFFQATIPVFTSFNLLLQREQSSIFLLHDEVQYNGRVGYVCGVLRFVAFFISTPWVFIISTPWVRYNFWNYCVVDDKLHPQAVRKVHGAYSATGPPRASRHRL